jgi:hypothetical protein
MKNCYEKDTSFWWKFKAPCDSCVHRNEAPGITCNNCIYYSNKKHVDFNLPYSLPLVND